MSTILLVDDEQDTLDLFVEVVEQMNHRALAAHDGHEALSIVRQFHPDLVVTDWMMPRMDGLELCHRLHEDAHLQDIPVILHSSSGDPHAPGTRFVPKSFPMDQFETLVNRVLASSHAQRLVATARPEEFLTPPEEAVGTSCAPCCIRLSGLGENTCSTVH